MSSHPSPAPGGLPDLLAGDLVAPHELRLKKRSIALLAAFGLSLLLIGLGSSRVLTYHEAVYAQPAREMLATGDWIIPRMGGVPFLDKPPGMAWSIAAAMRLFHSDREWVVRLPSALAGVATALLLAALAARWYGDRFGLVAGLVQLTSVHVLLQARLAEADMLLTAVVAAACVTFAWANIDGPQGRSGARWLPWLFYFLAGCSFLAKSMPGPIFIFGGCGLYVLVRRDWRSLWWLVNPAGWLLFVLTVGTWIVAACLRHPPVADALLLYNVGYYQGAWGHNEHTFTYVYSVPLLLLPWAPFVLPTIWAAVRRGGWRDPRWQFLFCWFAAGMGVLSTAAFKSKHYAIPLLPPLVLLAALGLVHFIVSRHRMKNPGTWPLAAASVVGAVLAAAAVERWCQRNTHATAALVAAMGVGVALVLYWEHRQNLPRQVATLFAVAWSIAVAVQLLVIPAHDTYLPQTQLAWRVNERVAPGEPVYLLALPENQVMYYLRGPIVRLDEPARQFPDRRASASADGVYALAPRVVADQYAAAGQAEIIERCAFLNRYLVENERLTFLRWHPQRPQTASSPNAAAR